MSKVKKWVAFIVMVCLLTTIMPTAVLADSTIQSKGTVEQYVVKSNDELNDALQKISKMEGENAEIILSANITLSDEIFGVKGKHITVSSSGTSQYTLSSGDNDIYLTGDVTFENVKIKAQSFFAQGYTVEFGENYTGTGLRLYGGSDKDLDLTTNGDEDGSTHIIIRNGSFVSIVGGNKDTFDQGEYHEYADWSDPETNIHTTLTGNVKIDIYGGRWGSGYNIDVGDTCCNTGVTPVRLYGGGLGSDTVGDITINVYDVDTGTNYNDNIVGGGFGMAGGEDDTTVDNDAIKHTGVVDGNVNLNLLGGYIAPFYGGGYHGGSAFKPSLNVTGERFNQSKYHRDKVAVVTGNVNIVMGGNMTLCQNTAEAWGGSYASTIGGDLKVTIKDNAKLAARYAMNNSGAPTPQNMNELINTYGQYYDGMYSGYGWRNRFYITGQYDIIKGDAILNIEGGYVWEIDGTTERMYGSELEGVKSTEVHGSMDINISGGMVNDLWGDYYGESIINEGINVNMTGGEVNALIAYNGRNDTLASGSQVSVDISGGTVYALGGSYSKLPNGVTSSLTLDSTNESEDNTLNIGYIEGFNSVAVKENANVLIDAVPVVQTIFGMPAGSSGEDSDLPFYRNIVDLNIKKDAILTTCKNETKISGNLTNTNGTWIANGKTTIGENANSTQGKIFFKEPSVVQENAAWDNTLLCLPVVQQGSNYDGTTNTDIALTVGGLSTGTAKVRTVNKEDHTQAVMPTVGENYVLSQKNVDTPAESVYTLENAEAVSAGLYLKRVNDPANEQGNFMWQVAKDERISIQPANVTIYMGGDGYEGTVNEDGQLITDSEQIKKNGFPEPGFLLTLPESLKNLETGNLYLQYKDEGTIYQWKFEKYGKGDHNVYRIVPDGNTEKRPVRMQFTRTLDNEQTETVTNDNFDVEKYINETLTMKVYGEGIEEHKVNFAYDKDSNGSVETGEPTYDIAIQDGTLTVRGTTSAVQTALVNKEESFTATKDQPGITAPEDTAYTINGSDVQVDDTTGISLLFDNIIDSNAGDENATYTDLLKAKVDKTLGGGDENRQYEYKYLDLVDKHNGNAWVAADKEVTVYWPLPEGADVDADFTLFHFQDLHRSMSPTDITNKLTADNYAPKEIQGTVEGDHIVFKVQPYNNGSGGFSPYVLVWEDESGNGGDSGENTPSTPVTPPDGDDTPDLNTKDHYSYVVGYEDGMVKPEKAITRAEVATIFYRLLKDDVRAKYWTKSNDFTDVTADDWYNTTVSTLNAMGIISGYEDGSFQPNAPITRAEFAAMAVRFFEEDSAIYEKGTFNDIAGSEWFADAVQAAKDHSIIGGYPDGSFQPNKNISRAEACSIINRTLDRIPDADHLLPEDLMKNWPDNNPGDWYYADMQEATNGHEYEWITDNGKTVENWTGDREEIDWAKVEEELEAMHGGQTIK